MFRDLCFTILVCVFAVASIYAYENRGISSGSQTERAAGSDGSLPDPFLTPGAVSTATKEEVCNTRTSTIRNVPESLKKQVYLRYGMKGKHDLWCNTSEGCEVDHLQSLEISGTNDINNLWPQPYIGTWNAHQKDLLENKLHKMVCDGDISLEEAQTAIRTNWIEAYKKYITEDRS